MIIIKPVVCIFQIFKYTNNIFQLSSQKVSFLEIHSLSQPQKTTHKSDMTVLLWQMWGDLYFTELSKQLLLI